MPMTYKHSGKRLQLNAAGTRTAGALVVDPIVPSGANTVFGIAQSNASAADNYWVETSGVHNITVPAGTTVGALLYAPGAPPTAGNAITLTATSTSNTVVGKIVSVLDATNHADVLLFPPRY